MCSLIKLGVAEGSTPVPGRPGVNFDMAQTWLLGYPAVNAEGAPCHRFQMPATW